jgi:hypothetical protein
MDSKEYMITFCMTPKRHDSALHNIKAKMDECQGHLYMQTSVKSCSPPHLSNTRTDTGIHGNVASDVLRGCTHTRTHDRQ